LRIGSSGVVWVHQDAPRGDDASSEILHAVVGLIPGAS
jgi:hypothetical protein